MTILFILLFTTGVLAFVLVILIVLLANLPPQSLYENHTRSDLRKIKRQIESF
ncbi:TPA: hypothetical protein HA371_02565 [Candidatus Woesearchaeota archaeon]|nr:hypothetical protein [Candidatus Woesearchaeota archaeon]